MRKLVVIDGTVELPEAITEDSFNELFLSFCEEHGLSFNGGTEYTEED